MGVPYHNYSQYNGPQNPSLIIKAPISLASGLMNKCTAEAPFKKLPSGLGATCTVSWAVRSSVQVLNDSDVRQCLYVNPKHE